MTAILEVNGLEKRFGGVVAAQNISVNVSPGETIGIIGANGAGKTTFVNMVTGHLPPSAGTIKFLGANVV
ncbi:ATP-binding cassette domain-containing protein, partial [Gammaproteobacteria bacterium]|nr:ATP-binding cassette domain-containing protein [Gammaproteobacteria bacterium]